MSSNTIYFHLMFLLNNVLWITCNSSMALKNDILDNGRPSFDDFNTKNVTSPVDKLVTLKCTVKNKGNRTVSWMRKRDLHILTSDVYTYTGDQRFSLTHSPETDNWDLKIQYVQLKDSGVYECQVNTDPKIYFPVFLDVMDSDTIQKRLNTAPLNLNKAKINGASDMYVKLGSTISLTCIVNVQVPSILWYHDSHIVNFNTYRGGISLETEKTNGGTTSRLMLTRAQFQDSGNYTCAPQGELSASTNVHVLNGTI